MYETADTEDERKFSIFFQINFQNPYELRNLSRREYIQLKLNDNVAVKRIEQLLDTGDLVNTDDNMDNLFKSIDGVDFTIIETSQKTDDSASSSSKDDTSIAETPQQKSDVQHKCGSKSSRVWQFYTKIDCSSARCSICHTILKHSGNTTNLQQHLSRKHPLFYTSNMMPVEKRRKRTVLESSNDVDDPSCSDANLTSVSTQPTPKRAKTEQKKTLQRDVRIDAAFSKTRSFADGGSSADRITRAVLYMIATDNLPLSTVENDGFRELVKVTAPLYTVPSRKTITRLMEAKYEMLKTDFQIALEGVKFSSFTLTCDNWTDVSNQSYLGVTIHYSKSDGTLKYGCLGVTPLNQNHTADYLSKTLLSVLESFGLQPENVTAVVSDSAANIKKAVCDTFGRDRFISCFAHGLSHLVQDVLADESMANVKRIIAKVREIVKLLKRSVVATDELKRIQIRDGKTDSTSLKFILDVPTRWNSTFYMLQRFVALEPYAYAVSMKCRNVPEMLTRDEIQMLKNLIRLLKPIESVIREISGDSYPTASLIIPILTCLKDAIYSWEPKNEECSEDVITMSKDFKDKLLAAIEQRLKPKEKETNLILAMSTILDPRFKKMDFQSRLAAAAAVTKIDSLLKINSKKDSAKLNAVPTTSQHTESDESSNVVNIWKYHDEMVTNNIESTINDDNGLSAELKQYLKQPVISRCADPLKHWQIIKIAYPSLYKVSLQYLSIVATSVPSERLFSKAGVIKTENRNRISGEHLNKLLFLGSLTREEWGF